MTKQGVQSNWMQLTSIDQKRAKVRTVRATPLEKSRRGEVFPHLREHRQFIQPAVALQQVVDCRMNLNSLQRCWKTHGMPWHAMTCHDMNDYCRIQRLGGAKDHNDHRISSNQFRVKYGLQKWLQYNGLQWLQQRCCGWKRQAQYILEEAPKAAGAPAPRSPNLRLGLRQHCSCFLKWSHLDSKPRKNYFLYLRFLNTIYTILYS